MLTKGDYIMNAQDVKELKKTYEEAIVEQIATALKVQPQQITANWSLEQTTVDLRLFDNNNNITNFQFQYTDDNFVISTSSYQAVLSGEMVVGIVAGTATVNLYTLEAIRTIINGVVNSSVNEEKCEGEADA
jgi:hypothetical protein